MKPTKLIMSAWGPYKNEETLDFEKDIKGGLFLITGKTGAGKTTIFDAVAFALFGDLSGDTRKKDSVRSDFAEDNTETYVYLEFEHKGDRYTIRRNPKYQRKKIRGEGYRDISENATFTRNKEALAQGAVEVNKKVSEIIGISYTQFKQLAMIAQGEFMNLLNADSKDRTEIFRNIFNTQIYERFQKILSEKTNALVAEKKNNSNSLMEIIKNIEIDDSNIDYDAPNYNEIVKLLEQKIEEDTKDKLEAEKAIKLLRDEKDTLLKSAERAKKNNETLQKEKEAKELYEQAIGKKDNIEKQNEAAKSARKAHMLRPLEVEYKVNRKNRKITEENINVNEENKAKKNIELEKAKKELDENPKREQEKEKLLLRLNKLKESVPVLEKLYNLNTVFEQKKKENEKAVEMIRLGKDKVTAMEKNIEEYNQKIDILRTADEKLAVLNENYSNIKTVRNETRALADVAKRVKLLIIEFEELNERYFKAINDAADKKSYYEEKEKLFKLSTAGLLARYLEEGEPCPVCGSKIHPVKAELMSDVPDEKEVEAAKKAYEQAFVNENRLKETANAKKLMYDDAITDFDVRMAKIEKGITINTVGEFLDKCNKALENVEKEMAYYKAQTEIRDDMTKKLRQEQEAKKVAANMLEEMIEKNNSLRDDYSALEGQIKEIKNSVEDSETDITLVKEQIKKTEYSIINLTNKMDSVKNDYDKISKEYENIVALLENDKTNVIVQKEKEDESLEVFREKCIESGFTNYNDYSISLMDEAEIIKLEKAITDYYNDLAAKEEYLKKLSEDVKGIKAEDIGKYNIRVSEVETEIKNIEERINKIRDRLLININGKKSIEEKLEKTSLIQKEYGILSDISNAANGNNSKRLIFEQYILSAYFDEILVAANMRFAKMTNGRYELYRISEVADARKKDSLMMEVLDNYTGRRRSVKTLSGGESFKAALSLALGMSDIIQNNAGGIEIDILFIDEGFGALDNESLDQAINSLTSLVSGNRLIGIISHVNELKERIDSQVLINKTNTGSYISIQ